MQQGLCFWMVLSSSLTVAADDTSGARASSSEMSRVFRGCVPRGFLDGISVKLRTAALRLIKSRFEVLAGL